MDLTESIQPRSDQTNADDFLAGPQTVTVVEVHKGASAEQPVDIVLAEFGTGRPFKPSKTVRRILVAGWGAEAEAYVGRRMTLYCDPDVKFGGATVGGIRVSHMSHLDKPLNLKLTTTRGKRAPFTVQPLAEVVRRDFLVEAEALNGDKDTLRALWIDAKAAGEPVAHLDTIAAMVTPDVAPAA